MPLANGQIINTRYRIIRLLGQGGFGAVYQAWDQNLDRACALKENLETSDEISRQFEREARLLANLSHPNLPRVTDHFRITGQGQYLVMDYIEGEDLDKRLERLGHPLLESELLGWVFQVCDALSYLHHHDPPIIHRDIKPANIRITPKGQAMLVDFGIAKMFSPSTRTTIGARAVTPGFSPPEQYGGRGETDERSDIYSLGATLYTLLTGQVPPESVDLMAGNAPPLPPVQSKNNSVSSRVSLAIARAMQLAKLHRFQSIQEFKTAMQPETELPRTIVVAPIGTEESIPAPRPAEAGATVYPGQGSGGFAPALPGGGTPGRALPLQESNIPSKPGSRVIRAPRSKPRRSTGSWLVLFLTVGLGFAGLALVVVMGVMSVLDGSQAGAVTRTSPRPGAETPGGLSQGGGTPVGVIPTTEAAPTVDSPPPSDTPPPSQPVGAIDVRFEGAKLAFVSDHREDRKERIFSSQVRGGEYWYLPGTGEVLRTDGSQQGPFTQPEQIPADEAHDMAWWPEWCADDRQILFEAQDTTDPNFQTIYAVDAGGNSEPIEIRWEGYSMLGVPRCSHSEGRVLVSALIDDPNATWELYWFPLASPTTGTLVHDGYPFAGNSAWSGDDRWVVFMRRPPGEGVFSLVRFAWDSTAVYTVLPRGAEIADSKYPAISPISGEIAFACSDRKAWNLCLMSGDGQDLRAIPVGVALDTTRPRPKRSVPAVTPSWSPDGQWIAYASNLDGDWDVYLYSPSKNISINITNGLEGDQFQPNWSKLGLPSAP